MAREIIFYNLEAELLRAKLIKGELAAMIGISVGSMSSKFTGKTEFTLDEMLNIKVKLEELTGLSYTLDYLFERGE
jgi:hypothetical protein